MKQKNGKGSKPFNTVKGKTFIRKGSEGKAVKEPDNPFDKFANARKKHEVLNRRVKGEDRNVGRARGKAIDERKSKLLKEYNTNKKTNTFVDRRFGESDANMSLEERMFMRFQQERVKKVRNSSVFNLDGNDTEILTHKGQILGDSNIDDRDYFSSDEEGGGKLDKEVVNKLHFGGGMVEAKNNREETVSNGKRGRLDALQEIVMKSKLHKMERKEAKEEQEDERSKLDKEYDALFASDQLQLEQPQQRRRMGRGAEEELDPLDAYDVSLREMAYETKVKPSDRTKTPEELALAAQQKIEELEKARLKRMKLVDAPEAAEERVSGVVANSTAKKSKHITDDQIVDMATFVSAKDRKAAKEAAARAAKEAEEDGEQEEGGDGFEDEEYSDEEEEEDETEDEDSEGEESGGEEDEEDGSEEDGGDEDNEGEEEEDEYEEMDYDEQTDEKLKGRRDRQQGSDDDLSEEEDDSDDEGRESGRFDRRRPRKSKEYVDDGVNLKMPHKIKCPVDLEAFDDLVDQFVRCDTDLFALVDRILAWNSVHLPGPQGQENKNLMHNFLDILLKHFVRVGDSLSNAQNDLGEVKTHLNFLTTTIFKLCQTLAEGCVPLWGRTLKIMQSQLQKRLRDYALGNRDSCWPSLGRLLLLQQLGHVFSVTDLKNEIVGPATLFLCQCLSQCPVATVKDIASGVLACNIVLSYTAETKRFVPEVLAFVHVLMSQYLHVVDRKQFQSTFNSTGLSWLRPKAATAAASSSNRLAWSSFSSKPSQSEEESASAILSACYALLDTLVSYFGLSSAAPELFDSLVETLQTLRPQDAPALKAFKKRHVEALERLLTAVQSVRSSRLPLQWRKAVNVSIDMKMPRFELDYTFKKDSDPDRERVQLKQLNRQFKREKKAAMRELRRDSAFIDQERHKEVTAAKEAKRAERVKNFGWMEEQAATVNQQVRQGKGLMTGGGSGISKKARVKRL